MTKSEQRCLQQVLTTEELGHRKSSEPLLRMRQLLGDKAGKMDQSILKQLLLKRLPKQISVNLCTSEFVSIPTLA